VRDAGPAPRRHGDWTAGAAQLGWTLVAGQRLTKVRPFWGKLSCWGKSGRTEP
jgi:hypothetical protein